MDNAYLLSFLTQKNIPTIIRKHHTYLTYYGLEQQYTYVLKEGVIKTSIILKDGREFNFAYLQGPDIISLIRDEVSSYWSSNTPMFSKKELLKPALFSKTEGNLILLICKALISFP